MADFYVYFIASLPMLHFGMKPPFSFAAFIQRSHELLPAEDAEILAHLGQPEEYATKVFSQATLKQWVAYDAALRNELAKIRASRKHLDPASYIRPEGQGHAPYFTQAAWQLYRNPHILDAEMMFDQMRWKVLDELAIGHYFDLGFLITYAYKLQILERWENIRRANAPALLEEALK